MVETALKAVITKPGETLLGGNSLAVTDDGDRELGHRDVELCIAG